MKEHWKEFVISGEPKTDVDSYFDQTKPQIKTLIKNQLKEMGPAKVIMTLWLRWKKPIMLVIVLGAEDVENAQDVDGNTSNNYIKVEMLFNRVFWG